MRVLRQGSRGHEVEFLQRLLTNAASRDGVTDPGVFEDGIFGPITERALRDFQRRHSLAASSGSTDASTWQALGLRTEVEHGRVRSMGQPTGSSCWSVAASMILGNQSVGSGHASLDPLDSSLRPDIANVEVFARSLNWRMLQHTPGVQEMERLARATPLWIGVRWTGRGGTSGRHAIVVSGVYSTGEANGQGTMFRIHDPWPVGSGQIYGSWANPFTWRPAPGAPRNSASLECVLIPS
jgi:hypothetical protein